jgi:tetratricopeptide (TPR) repeat protein
MSDDRKGLLEGLGDLDWESALDEWEKNAFSPEVARDTDTNQAATPLGKAAPRPEPPPQPVSPGPPSEPTLSAKEPERTVIAPVPVELRDEPPSTPPRPSAPPSARGGLDQLFSRPKAATPSKPMVAAPPRPSPTSERNLVAGRPPRPEPPKRGEAAEARTGDAPFTSPESERTLVKANPLRPRPQKADLEDLAADEKTAERPAAQLAPLAPDFHRQKTPAAGRVEERTRAPSVPPPSAQDDEDENETVVRDRGSLLDADTETRLRGEQRAPVRPSAPPALRTQTGSFEAVRRRRTSEHPLRFHAERPSSGWLDEDRRRAFLARIAWLEEEARAVADATARGRSLLAISELCALVGDTERALSFACEARDLAPHLPLAWRQARQLGPQDPDLLVDALDAEAARSPTPSARAHATLLAADLLRIHGQGDAAVERWESACKLDPADTRAPIARAALALAQDDHTSGALHLSDNSELIGFDKAVATALRLRGIERPGADVEDMPINDGLRHVRLALENGDVVSAAQSASEIASVPELAKAALWLSAALGCAHIASRRASARALKTLSADEPLARRQLAARGIELGDPELVTAALGDAAPDGPFTPVERATVYVLASRGELGKDAAANMGGAATAKAIASDPALAPLEDAILSLAPVVATDDDDHVAVARARRVAGKPEARALATLGRLLASKATDLAIEEALEAVTSPRSPSATGVAIESAVRSKRWGELSEIIASMPLEVEGGSDAYRHVAAAFLAERAGDGDRARRAWVAAARTDAPQEGIVRIAAALDDEIDLGAELLRSAEQMPDNLASSVVRLEAIARGAVAEEDRPAVLDRVHRGAPSLGIGAFFAERLALRKGDVEEALRWIQERRAYATDPLETAIDSTREALLVADREPEVAAARIEEAHRARPDDVALREFYERLAMEPPPDRGAWRERRAGAATGASAALFFIEAALAHDRAGDGEAMLQAARKAAELGDRGLSRPLVERGEIETGQTTRQTEELIEVTKTSNDEAVRREALERLAALDAFGRNDQAAALLWHRSILETSPQHKKSLRWIEHALIGEGRDDELAPLFEQIAVALDGTAGGEVTAHAQHAARIRAREAALLGTHDGPSAWERTYEMARLAASQPQASLWSLRALNAHARLRNDDNALLKTSLALLERTQRPAERASLLLRASEAAARLEQIADARTYLEQAASEDAADVVTWGFLAEVLEREGELRLAAEACENLARTSAVPEHQILAWHDAARIWLDEVNDVERGMSALEAAAEIDVTFADVFPRLSQLYADKRLDSELATLLEKRLATVQDEDERVNLEVELARTFTDMGELGKAKSSLESALATRPDHTTALAALAGLCAKEGDWSGAEQAYVRLARRIVDPLEQKAIYERLGEVYAVHAPNLPRAEMAFKEVLKRAPEDTAAMAKLVDVYKRMGDVQHAVEMQQEIIRAATDPDVRLSGLVELARIYETVGRDPRRSEQVLDSARKEFPTSVVALRAMAEFYARQRQMPAMQILLDRAAADARRAFAQGRFVPSLFQVLHAAFDLRGKRDAARVVAATLAAVEGQPSDLVGAEARAVDPQLDDLLAPDAMSPALRALLFRAGDALDVVAPIDLRAVRAAPLEPGTPIGATVGSVATIIGLGALQILVSPVIGRAAIPLATNPPTLLVGDALAKVKNERARMFVVVRALKMILSHASAMLRGSMEAAGGSRDLVSTLVAALFCAFNPSFVPQNVDTKRVNEIARRIGPALPRNLDPTVGVIALEAAGMVGTAWSSLAPAAAAWANRVALLAVGDPNAALDALAWAQGEDAAPTGSEERAAWIARNPEARDLMTFSVTDAYAEARIRLGLDR